MAKGPEELSSISVPESQKDQGRLSSIFSIARRLRTLPSEVVDLYRNESRLGKVSMGFMTLGFVDAMQVVANRMILHLDPLLGTVEIMSDLGMGCAANNLRHSSFRKLAVVSGVLGMVGSGLAKTGNPDFVMPALVVSGISAAHGMLDMVTTHELAQEARFARPRQ